MSSVIVTTARRPGPAMCIQAAALAHEIDGRLVPRGELSLVELGTEGAPVVVVESGRVVCHAGPHPFFFHPGMLRMRVMGGPNREPDPLLRALDLRTGDFVLDATVGRGGDAVMIALAVGATGRVVGLEASGIIAAITRLGLATYEEPDAAIREAMRRVHVIHANHERYLASCREGSFDIVYFDPMFDRPLTHCPSIDPIRTIATHETLSGEALLEAQRVARRRVVVKNRKGSDTLESLGIHTIVGGRWSRVEYGVVE